MLWFWLAAAIVFLFGFAVFFGAPYVPSQRKYVRRVFSHLYKVGSKDLLVDIGAGDGIVLRIASQFGARAVGYEINPVFFWIARYLSRGDKKVEVHLANFWLAELPSKTTVVYAFSVMRDGPRLEKKLQAEANRLGRPLTLLSHGNPLPHQPLDGAFEAYYRYVFHPLHEK